MIESGTGAEDTERLFCPRGAQDKPPTQCGFWAGTWQQNSQANEAGEGVCDGSERTVPLRGHRETQGAGAQGQGESSRTGHLWPEGLQSKASRPHTRLHRTQAVLESQPEPLRIRVLSAGAEPHFCPEKSKPGLPVSLHPPLPCPFIFISAAPTQAKKADSNQDP